MFAKLPWVQCLGRDKTDLFDIAFIRAPFVHYLLSCSLWLLIPHMQDTSTSYHPSACFGPAGIYAGSCCLTLYGGYSVPLAINPFLSGLKVVDCGDIPITLYDNKFTIKQIKDGHKELLHCTTFLPLGNNLLTNKPLMPISANSKNHLHVIMLGGDHTIILLLLQSIYSTYSQISIIHFNSHLDTWKPQVFRDIPSEQVAINHSMYFY